MAARKSGLKIDVARVVEIVLDSSTGETIVRFRDKRGRIVAAHLPKRQFNALLKRVLAASRQREAAPRSSNGRQERAILKAALAAARGNVSRERLVVWGYPGARCATGSSVTGWSG